MEIERFLSLFLPALDLTPRVIKNAHGGRSALMYPTDRRVKAKVLCICSRRKR
jgi:hypothetical protein